jgi:hypothetical protein
VKVSGIIFSIFSIFFFIVTPVYWLLSGDPTGTTALVLTFGLSFMLAFYLLFVAKRLGGTPPEDRADGEIYEAAGEYGFFSPKSWAPLTVALSASVVTLGLVFGWWLAIIGVAMLIVTVMQWVYEYYRGEFAH